MEILEHFSLDNVRDDDYAHHSLRLPREPKQ